MDKQTNSPPSGANRRRSGWFLSIAAASTAACAAWIVAWIAGAAESGATANFDAHILLSLRNPVDTADPLGPGWVEELVRDLTDKKTNMAMTRYFEELKDAAEIDNFLAAAKELPRVATEPTSSRK